MDFAHNTTSNARELEGALKPKLIAHAKLFGRTVTVEGAQEVLHDVLKAHDRRVSIEEIQKRVAEHFSIRLTDMSSARRAPGGRAAAAGGDVPGQAGYPASPPEIGRRFGNRDHTTVMHAVSRVGELMTATPFAEDVELLRLFAGIGSIGQYRATARSAFPAVRRHRQCAHGFAWYPGTRPCEYGCHEAEGRPGDAAEGAGPRAECGGAPEHHSVANVMLAARDGKLTLTATDMEIAMVEDVPASTTRNGSGTAPAATLYEIVRNFARRRS